MSNPAQSGDAIVTFTVNGRDVEIRAPEDGSLLMALRHDLGLKGTRIRLKRTRIRLKRTGIRLNGTGYRLK